MYVPEGQKFGVSLNCFYLGGSQRFCNSVQLSTRYVNTELTQILSWRKLACTWRFFNSLVEKLNRGPFFTNKVAKVCDQRPRGPTMRSSLKNPSKLELLWDLP